MTIRTRLRVNIGITALLFIVCFSVMAWGAYRYQHLQRGTKLLDHQVQGWLTLNFQVSQYMKIGLEQVLSTSRFSEDDFSSSTNSIIHTFISLERTARAKQSYLSENEKKEQAERLVSVREQFGILNAELETAISYLEQGQKQASIKAIRANITETKLDGKFIEQIEIALKNERQQSEKLDVALAELKLKLIVTFSILAAFCLSVSIFILSWISRTIQNSIERANRELLRGTANIAAGDFNTRLVVGSRDELAVVGEAFNKMTGDLKIAWETIERQQTHIASSSKMSALGEMAGGVAHEINNPLAVIKNLSSQLQEVLEDDPLDKTLIKDMALKIENTTNRIAKIVMGLRSFSRDGSKDPFLKENILKMIDETLSFCSERFKNSNTNLIVEDFAKDLNFDGRATEVSQVLLNLLNNANDAISDQKEKWIKVSVLDKQKWIEIRVTDCGKGIPQEIQQKIFQPFFTTKDIGKGTGMGLSISVGIIKSHCGELTIDNQCPNTCFVIRLPKKQEHAHIVSAA